VAKESPALTILNDIREGLLTGTGLGLMTVIGPEITKSGKLGGGVGVGLLVGTGDEV